MSEPGKEKTLNEPGQEKTLAEQAPSSHECRACGYVYEPAKGDNQGKIDPGTVFIIDIGATGAPSGFAENLNYGLGVNRMTPGQKNLLIFGALALGFLFFLSLYGLN